MEAGPGPELRGRRLQPLSLPRDGPGGGAGIPWSSPGDGPGGGVGIPWSSPGDGPGGGAGIPSPWGQSWGQRHPLSSPGAVLGEALASSVPPRGWSWGRCRHPLVLSWGGGPGGGVNIPWSSPRGGVGIPWCWDTQEKKKKTSLQAQGSRQRQSCLERGHLLIASTTEAQAGMRRRGVAPAGVKPES